MGHKIFSTSNMKRFPLIVNGIITTSKSYCLNLSLLDQLLFYFKFTNIDKLDKKYNDKIDKLLI